MLTTVRLQFRCDDVITIGMVQGSCRFALGKDHPALERAGGIQVLSGTGALRTAGEFVADFCKNKDIYVSSPTWGNHNAIFKRCGLNVVRT